MQQIRCPWCGLRDEAEFLYRGDATVSRPPAGASEAEFFNFAYSRRNPKGWHLEWWHHVAGCRRLVKVLRHTVTHEIRATGWPGDRLERPE